MAVKQKTNKKEKKPEKAKPLPGKPLKFPDLDKLKADIEAYFAYCNPHIEYREQPVQLKSGNFQIIEVPYLTAQQPYTISELAYFLGTTRRTLLDYEHFAEANDDDIPLHLRTKDPYLLKEYSHTIKMAKARVEGFVERKLIMGGGHPAGPIFSLKNNFKNWEDKTVVENPAEAEYHKQVEELRGIVTGRLKDAKNKKKR